MQFCLHNEPAWKIIFVLERDKERERGRREERREERGEPNKQADVYDQTCLTDDQLQVFLLSHSVLVSWSCHNKEPQPGGLNNRNVSFHSSGGQKSQIKVWQGWFLVRTFFLAYK